MNTNHIEYEDVQTSKTLPTAHRLGESKSWTPEEAKGHFGWLAAFVGWDIPASSVQTRKQLGWNPTGPGLIADLKNMRYS